MLARSFIESNSPRAICTKRMFWIPATFVNHTSFPSWIYGRSKFRVFLRSVFILRRYICILILKFYCYIQFSVKCKFRIESKVMKLLNLHLKHGKSHVDSCLFSSKILLWLWFITYFVEFLPYFVLTIIC